MIVIGGRETRLDERCLLGKVTRVCCYTLNNIFSIFLVESLFDGLVIYFEAFLAGIDACL